MAILSSPPRPFIHAPYHRCERPGYTRPFPLPLSLLPSQLTSPPHLFSSGVQSMDQAQTPLFNSRYISKTEENQWHLYFHLSCVGPVLAINNSFLRSHILPVRTLKKKTRRRKTITQGCRKLKDTANNLKKKVGRLLSQLHILNVSEDRDINDRCVFKKYITMN